VERSAVSPRKSQSHGFASIVYRLDSAELASFNRRNPSQLAFTPPGGGRKGLSRFDVYTERRISRNQREKNPCVS
jgi:hypothetical protein